MLPIQPQLDHFGVTTDEVGGVAVSPFEQITNALKHDLGCKVDEMVNAALVMFPGDTTKQAAFVNNCVSTQDSLIAPGSWFQLEPPPPSLPPIYCLKLDYLYPVVMMKPEPLTKGDILDLLLRSYIDPIDTIPHDAPINQRRREEGEEDL